jgi:hypothetical protein
MNNFWKVSVISDLSQIGKNKNCDIIIIFLNFQMKWYIGHYRNKERERKKNDKR